MSIETVKDLLRTMCPGYTEHAFACQLSTDGRVQVHVAVADAKIGHWDAPHEQWHSFEFKELFAGMLCSRTSPLIVLKPPSTMQLQLLFEKELCSKFES